MTNPSNILLYSVAVFFRLGLMHSKVFGLSERPELATPLNSFKRLKEGVYLDQIGQDPYGGVLFHETPFMLKVFSFLFAHFSETFVGCVFIIFDILTAIVLSYVADLVAKRVLRKQRKELDTYHKDAKENLMIKESEAALMCQNVQVFITKNCCLKN